MYWLYNWIYCSFSDRVTSSEQRKLRLKIDHEQMSQFLLIENFFIRISQNQNMNIFFLNRKYWSLYCLFFWYICMYSERTQPIWIDIFDVVLFFTKTHTHTPPIRYWSHTSHTKWSGTILVQCFFQKSSFPSTIYLSIHIYTLLKYCQPSKHLITE